MEGKVDFLPNFLSELGLLLGFFFFPLRWPPLFSPEIHKKNTEQRFAAAAALLGGAKALIIISLLLLLLLRLSRFLDG